MMKKIDSQLDLAKTKFQGDESRVDLTKMNKYVGYASDKLKVDFLETSGVTRYFK